MLFNQLIFVWFQRNHQYFILYLGVFGVELGLIVILFIGGIIFFVDLGTPEVLSYFIPSGLVFLGKLIASNRFQLYKALAK